MRRALRGGLRGVQSLLRYPALTLLRISTLAVALSLLTVTLTLTENLNDLSQGWAEEGELLVFLESELSEERREELTNHLSRWSELEGLRYEGPEVLRRSIVELFQEPRRDGARSDQLLLDDVPLFATLELRLKSAHREAQARRVIRARIEELEGVDEVRDLGTLASTEEIVESRRIFLFGALFVALWVAAGVAFIIFNLVRLNLYPRREELTILSAVGATRGFIYGPLMVESALQVSAALFVALSLVDGLLELTQLRFSLELSMMNLSLLPLGEQARLALLAGLILLASVAAQRAARPVFEE